MKCYLSLLLLLISTRLVAIPFDYVVFNWSYQDGLSVYSYREVDLPALKHRPQASKSFNHIAIKGDKGKLLQTIDLDRALITRSEHHGHNHIQDSSFVNDVLTFVVRVPKGEAKLMELTLPNKSFSDEYDYPALLSGWQAEKVKPKSNKSGGNDNRINLLFMGDGYLANQAGLFDQHANAVMGHMHGYEPYASYGQFFSFDRLFLDSVEEGADHPVNDCGGVIDPLGPSLVNTRFDATFCTSGILRLLTVNSSKVYTDAALFPGWDEIVMLVNDSTYGGSGGNFSTISAHALAADIFIHEFGHTFTDLADEYDSAFPGFPACSDINGPSCEPNVTDVSNRSDLKWNYFVAQSTPIPTPDTAQYSSVTGLFEGARYLATGMYRPISVCNMKALGAPFCPVCSQAFVEKVYDVPYASGGGKLSLIEPTGISPGSQNVNVMVGQTQAFEINLLQPTHDLTLAWYIDNSVVGPVSTGLVQQVYNFTPSAGMANTTIVLKAEVKDPSPMVHSSLQSQLSVFEQSWTVTIDPMVDLIFKHGFDN